MTNIKRESKTTFTASTLLFSMKKKKKKRNKRKNEIQKDNRNDGEIAYSVLKTDAIKKTTIPTISMDPGKRFDFNQSFNLI